MGDKSAIEWTDATWNPITGCSKVSPGCAHCYAETLALNRLAGKPGYPGLPWTPENAAENVVLRPERLNQPLRWKRPRMIFVNSMSDLFHELVPFEYIDRVFAVMAAAPQHIFQVLTKRPERMRDYLTQIEGCGQLGDPPLGNVWLGTSIENRSFANRADALRETPAAVRFISAEPLLGSLVISPPDVLAAIRAGEEKDRAWYGEGHPPALTLDGIDWLIVGGESGAKHRRMDPDWVRDLRDRAVDAGTAFFFKQWGGYRAKAGGRELDGRTWDQMPI